MCNAWEYSKAKQLFTMVEYYIAITNRYHLKAG